MILRNLNLTILFKMALIICIETSTIACSVALSKNGELISFKEDFSGNSHSLMLLPFIDEILKNAKLNINEIDAFAVSKGPGSYTGLRIGVSTVKGLCYATEKPMIAIDTLQSMALGISEIVKNGEKNDDLFCPLIDARRMEVYSAIYNIDNKQIREPVAEIINDGSFSDFLANKRVFFAGDALNKCKIYLEKNKNSFFIDNFLPSAKYMCSIAEKNYINNTFVDTAYFEPFYLKDFVAKKSNVKGLY